MSNLKLLRTILRLKSLKITHFRFLHREKELHLAVKPYKNGCRWSSRGRSHVASPSGLRRGRAAEADQACGPWNGDNCRIS